MNHIQQFLYRHCPVFSEHVDFYTNKKIKATVYQQEIYNECMHTLSTCSVKAVLDIRNNPLLQELRKEIEWYYLVYDKKQYPFDVFNNHIHLIHEDMSLLQHFTQKQIDDMVTRALHSAELSTAHGRGHLLFLEKILTLYPLQDEHYKHLNEIFIRYKITSETLKPYSHGLSINNATCAGLMKYIGHMHRYRKQSVIVDFIMQHSDIQEYIYHYRQHINTGEMARYMREMGYDTRSWFHYMYTHYGIEGVTSVFKFYTESMIMEFQCYHEDTFEKVLPTLLNNKTLKNVEDLRLIYEKIEQSRVAIVQGILHHKITMNNKKVYGLNDGDDQPAILFDYPFFVTRKDVENNIDFLLNAYFAGEHMPVLLGMITPDSNYDLTVSQKTILQTKIWVENRISSLLGQDFKTFVTQVLPLIVPLEHLNQKMYEKTVKTETMRHLGFGHKTEEISIMV